MKILISIFSTIAGLFLLGLIIMYSGAVNVSVLDRPSGLTKWFLSTTMDRSVETRADDIQAPDLNHEDMIREGAEHYMGMCQGCHGAPGREDTEMAKGLEPIPPHLYEREYSEDFDPREAFWITKNGIMMTAMPAWGTTHSDEKIWEIVAFLKKLPEMSPEEYSQLASDLKSEPMEEHEHDEGMDMEHEEHEY
jgi:mono/diheme cytochrome c family protein